MTISDTFYCIDTSALFYLEDTFSVDVFPDVWERLADLVASESMVAPREVLRELEKKTDNGALSWTKHNRAMFRELDADQITIASELVNSSRFHELIDVESELPDADPFVVALAVTCHSQFGLLLKNVPAVVAVEEIGVNLGLSEVCESDMYPIRFLSPYQMLEELGLDVPSPGGIGLAGLYGAWNGMELTEEEIAESKLKTRGISI